MHNACLAIVAPSFPIGAAALAQNAPPRPPANATDPAARLDTYAPHIIHPDLNHEPDANTRVPAFADLKFFYVSFGLARRVDQACSGKNLVNLAGSEVALKEGNVDTRGVKYYQAS